jgi:hypothetical protein
MEWNAACTWLLIKLSLTSGSPLLAANQHGRHVGPRRRLRQGSAEADQGNARHPVPFFSTEI